MESFIDGLPGADFKPPRQPSYHRECGVSLRNLDGHGRSHRSAVRSSNCEDHDLSLPSIDMLSDMHGQAKRGKSA